MRYLSNAFSLQMFDKGRAEATPISATDAKTLVGMAWTDSGWSAGKDRRTGFVGKPYLPAESVIGHPDICRVINESLGLPAQGLEYPVKRVSVTLEPGDTLVVGQYVGPRLPEGATELPEGASIRWYRVDIVGDDVTERRSKQLARVEKVAHRFEVATHDYAHGGGTDPKLLEDAAVECFPGIFGEMWE